MYVAGGLICFNAPFHPKKLSLIIINFPGKKNMLLYGALSYPKIVDLPKMDGENNGKPYVKMDDLGGKCPHQFEETTHICGTWV